MGIKGKLQNEISKATEQLINEGLFRLNNLPDIILEVPPEKEFGDYGTNFAMQIAKAAKTDPRIIAQAIIDCIRVDWIEKAVIAGPGFINFYLKNDWIYELLADILLKGEDYGSYDNTGGSKIQVEFVSANPTGPLHIGHGRGAAVGSSLVNLLRAAGNQVSAEYYINDAGNQMDNLAASVNSRYLELLGQIADFPEDGYHGQDIIDTAKRIIAKDGDMYLQLCNEDRLTLFKDLARDEKLACIKEDLENFGVNFDVWFSERTLHPEGVDNACKLLKGNSYGYDREGAFWLKSTAYGDDKDRVIIRENGVPTYIAADIAYHRNKFERGFDTIINIWGADHHGYIKRMKAAVAAMGNNPDNLEVLLLQMVNLYQSGELVKMSKRTGQSVTLVELIEEVGRDAARYFFIMRSSDSQFDFDLDLAKSKSNENPVYYIQYAFARISSIFRQAQEAGIIIKPWQQADLTLLCTQSEINIIKKLGEYPEEIAVAAKKRAPHYIARYAHELAGDFHSFYNQHRIIGVDSQNQSARIALLIAIKNTIAHTLKILGVNAPERM